MKDKPAIVLFQGKGRDIAPLKKACVELGYSFLHAESDDALKKYCKETSLSCIIVNLADPDTGSNDVRKFIDSASDIFEPELSDVAIIYSTENSTPKYWPGALDPRPIKSYDQRLEPFATSYDTSWKNTISQLHQIKSTDRLARNPTYVNVGIGYSSESSFPTEASYLVRAAFKDMATVIIEFPKQGLSGSIACVAQPINSEGEYEKKFFAKIYPEQDKAQEDIDNHSKYITPLGVNFSPSYQPLRRYKGKKYSIVVTDLIESPSNLQVSFSDLIFSNNPNRFSVKDVSDLLKNIFKAFNSEWKIIPAKHDLVEVYLTKFFSRPTNASTLESENNCHRWFGTAADNKLLAEKIKQTIPSTALVGTISKVCHGDLHCDNIMIRQEGNDYRPVFIDFSRTKGTHALVDIVTLESDMIIRGLSGIRAFSTPQNVIGFLNGLDESEAAKQGPNQWSYDAEDLLQLAKVEVVIRELRKVAIKEYSATDHEFLGARLFKTLEVLSYGKLPPSQNMRACTYVKYLIGRLKG